MPSPPTHRYKPVQRYLHWIIFALVVAAYVLINIHFATARGTTAHALSRHAHMLVGVAVLLLALPRLWARGKYGAPPIEPPVARWSRLLARITHWALYAFLVVQPLLGILTMQVAGHDVGIFGVTIIPSFVSHPNRGLSREIFQYHVWIGTAFYYVIALHILAALWHHCVRRDDTMRRMLGKARRGTTAVD